MYRWKYLLARHSLVLVITVFFGILLTFVGNITLQNQSSWLNIELLKHAGFSNQEIVQYLTENSDLDTMEATEIIFEHPDIRKLQINTNIRDFLFKKLSSPFNKYLVLLPKFLKFGGGYLLYLFLLYLFWAIKTVKITLDPKTGKSIAEMQADIRRKNTLMEKDENKGIWIFGRTIPRTIKTWLKDWWVVLVLAGGVITAVKYILDIISFFSNKR